VLINYRNVPMSKVQTGKNIKVGFLTVVLSKNFP
jgi:hypothetical protein